MQFGDLLIVPIEGSFVYVQSIFVSSSGAATAIPELKRVVVVHGGNVSIANTLPDALAASFGQPPPTGGGGGGGGQLTVAQLLQQALQHFQAAGAALKAGNLALYQQEINAAQALIQQANTLAGTQGGTPSPGASPSPSP